MPPRRRAPASSSTCTNQNEETVTAPTLAPPSRPSRSKKTPATSSATLPETSAATSSPTSAATSSTTSRDFSKIPTEIKDFFHEHKDNLTESTFRSFCETHLTKTTGGVPPGLPKYYWRTLLKGNPAVSRRIGKKSIGKKRTKKNVVNSIVKINVDSSAEVGSIVGIGRVTGAEGDDGEVSEEDREEEGATPATLNELLLDLNTCNDSTREAALLRMPPSPPAPKSYTVAAQQFLPELLHSGDIPDQTSIDSPSSDTIFYFRYIRNTLQTVLRLRQKFLQPSWSPEIKEGWYDSNLWPHFIDYLFSRSSTLSLLRKELAIIPGQSERDRYDGVFRCIKKGFRFDLGVIEVSRLSDRPNSDMKTKIDRRKILRAMQSLLGWARKRVEEEGLQVVGILCSGWMVTLFRMSYDVELKYIVDEQHFGIEWDENFHENLEIMEALVRHVEIMEQTAAVIVSKGRMLN